MAGRLGSSWVFERVERVLNQPQDRSVGLPSSQASVTKRNTRYSTFSRSCSLTHTSCYLFTSSLLSYSLSFSYYYYSSSFPFLFFSSQILSHSIFSLSSYFLFPFISSFPISLVLPLLVQWRSSSVLLVFDIRALVR